MQWFVHMMRRKEDEETIKKVWSEPIREKISRGRQRLWLWNAVERDLKNKGLREEDAEENGEGESE